MKTPLDRRPVRTWIEVDCSALEHNLILFRTLLPPGCRLMAICKSNAYGHGLYDLAPVWEEMGVDWFGVDSLVEAVTLRKKGVRKPILVLGHTLPAWFGDAVKYGISLTVSSLENLRLLTTFPGPRPIRVHLKIDTGMHRQGFLPSQWMAARALLMRRRGRIQVEGIYTHFACAKDPADRGYTSDQIKEFDRAVAFFGTTLDRPIRHASATAGALNYPEAAYDLVRIGIGLMGHWPSVETKRAWDEKIVLKPALTWRTIISEVKALRKGQGIGYDLTETLKRDSRVGVCPIGYWHGFPRSLSQVGEVLIRKRRAKVLGTISMDMVVIDLTNAEGARAGDVVTVIGRDGREEISAYEVARRAGVSHYELLTRLNPLIQKYYVDRQSPRAERRKRL
jgi:alanine racemase